MYHYFSASYYIQTEYNKIFHRNITKKGIDYTIFFPSKMTLIILQNTYHKMQVRILKFFLQCVLFINQILKHSVCFCLFTALAIEIVLSQLIDLSASIFLPSLFSNMKHSKIQAYITQIPNPKYAKENSVSSPC